MKSVRFNSLLASTALGLVLVLGSHPGMAQDKADSVQVVVPLPDMSDLPPLTAQNFGGASQPAASKEEPKQNAAAPAAEPAKAEPTKTASEPASATGDSAVADQLRQMVTGKLDRIVPRKTDREGVEAFYKARDYTPLWVSNGAADARAKAAIAYLGQVDTVGLDPNDYPAPDFKSAATAETLAEDELKLTAAVLDYARQAQIGRIRLHPRQRRHSVRSGGAGAGQGAGQARRRERRRQGARQLQPAAGRVQGAARKARRTAQERRRRKPRPRKKRAGSREGAAKARSCAPA